MKDVLARLDRRKWKFLPYRRWVPFWAGGYFSSIMLGRIDPTNLNSFSVIGELIVVSGVIPALALWLTAEKPKSKE